MENDEVNNLIEKIEFIIGYTLPKKFKKFYTQKNLIINNVSFLSIDEIYDEICDATDDEYLEEELYTVEPQKSILEKAYDKKRLPIIKDYSGNFVGIDFNPGSNGIIGQIINYGCDEYKMKVLANCFEDFIEGIEQIDINEDTYIVDYLFEKNLNFRKNIKNNEIKKINSPNKVKEISQEKRNETVLEKQIKFESIEELIKILSTIDYKLRNDINIKKYNNYWFDYRIINIKDSLSRTMSNKEEFDNKLATYNKEEIKGYSFAIVNYIEEMRNTNLYVGEERMFLEINLLKNQILIRYTETIKNKIMLDTYNRIIQYVNSL